MMTTLKSVNYFYWSTLFHLYIYIKFTGNFWRLETVTFSLETVLGFSNRISAAKRKSPPPPPAVPNSNQIPFDGSSSGFLDWITARKSQQGKTNHSKHILKYLQSESQQNSKSWGRFWRHRLSGDGEVDRRRRTRVFGSKGSKVFGCFCCGNVKQNTGPQTSEQ